MYSNRYGIIFDLDMTLVDTSSLFYLREKRLWREVYKNIPKTKIYSGINDLISNLKQKFKLGIVTSSPRIYAEQLTLYHGIKIPILTAYHDTRLHKPNPNPIIHGCRQIGLAPDKIISIGDDEYDIIASNLAGATSVFASWGTNSITKNRPDYNCDSIDELNLLLSKYKGYKNA